MHRKWYTLILTTAVALLTLYLAFTQFRNTAILQTIPVWYIPFGILMVLVLPGYAITNALFPGIKRPAMVLMTLGLSITIDAIGALVLNNTRWGLQSFSWAVWLSGITLIGCIVMAFSRNQQSSGTYRSLPKLRVDAVVPFTIAVALIAASIIIARTAASRQSSYYTQLWAIPTFNETQESIQLGVRNLEQTEQHYDLMVESQGIRIAEWQDLVLEPGNTWTGYAPLDEKPTNAVRVLLYRASEPGQPYRTVTLSPVAFQPDLLTPNTH